MNLAFRALLAVPLGQGLVFAGGFLSSKKDPFSAPLSEAEERAAPEAWREGDGTARCRLVSHNLRLVAHAVKKFDAAREDDEDLISIGTVGLIKAVDTYDLSRGIRLATYAVRCMGVPHLDATPVGSPALAGAWWPSSIGTPMSSCEDQNTTRRRIPHGVRHIASPAGWLASVVYH